MRSKIAAVFSPPYMNQWFLTLAAGGTLDEPVTLPRTANTDLPARLRISADVRGLRVVPSGPDGALPDTVAKDPTRSVLLPAAVPARTPCASAAR